MPPLEPFVVITICLVVALTIAEFFSIIGSSIVIGMILAGVLLGLPAINDAFFAGVDIKETIDLLSNMGIVFLLFITGLEINYARLKSSMKEEGFIAFFSAFVPFGFGFLITIYLGYSYLIAFVVGAALSVTSEGTKIVVLMELKKLNTKVGTIMLGAGILDDVFEVVFLSFVIVLAHHGLTTELTALPLKIIAFILILIAIFKLFLPRLVSYSLNHSSQANSLGLIVVFGFIIASLSAYFGLGPIIGAFIGGVFLQLMIKNPVAKERIISQIKRFSFAIIIPFFFIFIGLNFDVKSVLMVPGLLLIILLVAIAGKIVGTYVVKPISKLSWRQLTLIGWGMNSRGAVELVIIEIARRNALIPLEIYSVLVSVAIITTFIFPFVMRYYVKKYPTIMD